MSTFLGIDIGTTSLKVCLIDQSQRIISELSKAHGATVEPENSSHSEQCPQKIITTLLDLIKQLKLKDLKAVCVSGQMHGIMLWDKNGDFKTNWPCSNLITWMDQRCDSEFLVSLPKWKNENGEEEFVISTGYGLATLAWLQKNQKIHPDWNTCGTIMDFFNFLLTKKCGFISDQLAYSFGYYSDWKNEWQEDCKDFLPEKLLPKIVQSDYVIGKLNFDFDLFYPKNVDVYIALGDLQTSLYKVVQQNQAVLHIGTSSQLAFTLPNKPKDKNLLLQVPYFNGQCLIVAASLNGGNVLELLAKKINQFYCDLHGIDNCMEISNERIKSLLDQAKNTEYSLEVDPLFYGERHAPEISAILANFSSKTTLIELFGSTASGIIKNLSKMMTTSFMKKWEIKEVKLLNRATHPVFERAAHKFFEKMDIINDESSIVSAAFGSACYACENNSVKI